MGTLVDRDVEEHRAEITRQNRTTPVVVLVILVCAVVAVLFTSSGGDDEASTPTSTSEPDATASTEVAAPSGPAPVVGAPPVVGVAAAGGRLFVFGSRKVGVMGAAVAPDLELHFGSPAIAVGDLLALLGPDGSVLVGREGAPFEPVACCFDDLIASNEPAHVWGIDGTSRAALVDLASGPVGVELDLDGERVIGLGPFGLVTIDGSQQATWRRPDFDPTVIEVPDGRFAMASGGDVIAYVVPDAGTVELRRIDDGSTVGTIAVPDPEAHVTSVVLSTAGDAIAITQGQRTTVFGLTNRRSIGRILGADQHPVPIGDRRFAAIVDGELVDSVVGKRPIAATPLVIATRAE